MKIEVFGPGCARCESLAASVKLAAERLGIDYELCKVTDLAEMAKRGIMVTPALVLDGEVELTGKVPTEDELVELLKTRSGGA